MGGIVVELEDGGKVIKVRGKARTERQSWQVHGCTVDFSNHQCKSSSS